MVERMIAGGDEVVLEAWQVAETFEHRLQKLEAAAGVLRPVPVLH